MCFARVFFLLMQSLSFFYICENESRNTQTGYILFLFIYLFGGMVLFQKLISSIAVQPMQWIQMIHNSHVFNMQIVKNSHLLFPINGMQRTKSICILSCRTNDKHNMLTILQGGMVNKLHTIHFSQMYEQIKSHNKSWRKCVPLTFILSSLPPSWLVLVFNAPKENKQRFAIQQRRAFHGSSDSSRNCIFMHNEDHNI